MAHRDNAAQRQTDYQSAFFLNTVRANLLRSKHLSDIKWMSVKTALLLQGYDADRIFRLSEEFFTSLGLIAMPQEFWDKTMFTKPTDRDVVCHASAWDFYNAVDFRYVAIR
jgi:hypothetical protein